MYIFGMLSIGVASKSLILCLFDGLVMLVLVKYITGFLLARYFVWFKCRKA